MPLFGAVGVKKCNIHYLPCISSSGTVHEKMKGLIVVWLSCVKNKLFDDNLLQDKRLFCFSPPRIKFRSFRKCTAALFYRSEISFNRSRADG